ncbi:ABC transporter ATP-binding protein [Aureispira anguillae]|uniref:ABC transporter ATP-binding protein n=1 Tax=Aureispira anguillae TaxID=2864201 RepID=A0A915YFB6_9BACT|nr:ABC transporter ATP-binding protein [Aureispira anguillae]BDS11956.1 ABC transporter ATP-binding protein [Aureispira anguillae]
MLRLDKLKIGHQKAVNATALNATFDIGNFVVLLGRNGCGKTTLLRTMGRFLKPLEGQVLLNEQSIQKYAAIDFSTQLSIVTTQRIQTPYLKVYDLIALGRYPYLGFLGKLQKKDHQVIQNILATLEIEHLANKYIAACSDGEQQMVLLARALAQDTPIVLLDEATAHLDFVNRIKIFQTLQKLAQEYQKLIFLATHELEIALKFANQVVLFHAGNIDVNVPTYFIQERIIQQVFTTEGLDYQLNI